MLALTERFKALGDPTRLRLVALLAVNGEICVCHLAAALDEPEYKVSRHLKVLRTAGWAEARREGPWMYYRLIPAETELDGCLQACFQTCLATHPTAVEDLQRLASSCCCPEEGSRG